MKKIHRLLLVAGSLFVASCANVPPSGPGARTAAGGTACPVCEPCRKCEEPAVVAPPAQPPLQPASFAELPGWADEDPTPAWPVFLRSCAAFKQRPAVWPLWQSSCEIAQAMPSPDVATIRSFFESRFQPWALTQPDGAREGTITGYYEPILKGSLSRSEKARYPVLGVPDDLLTVDFGDLYPELKKLRLRGRVEGNKVVPYFPRAEIRKREAGALSAKTLAWVEDAVELFFLHIQGSGRIALADGSQLRVGFADQNGHPYQSIGRLLVERGELKLEQASMQGIQAWARANPAKLDELLNANPSYVFFRELPNGNDGPPGALGVPLQAERVLAVDPRYTPLGAPVYLATTHANSPMPLNRLMMAQDTGGAIKGPVRADLYYGTGPEAGARAGRMKQKGRMWTLLPVGYPIPEAAK